QRVDAALEVAPGERAVGGPRRFGHGEVLAEPFQRMLRELAVGGDLPAVDAEQRRGAARLAGRCVDGEDVVARNGRVARGVVFVERTDSGVGEDDVASLDRLAEIL